VITWDGDIMKNFDDFLNEILTEDDELRIEMDILELKYMLMEEVVQYRKENGMSQTEFAELIGVKQQMISRFEKGNVDPRLSFVSKLLVGMNKSIKIEDKSYFRTDNIIKFKKKDIKVISENVKLNNSPKLLNCI
tara:strand:- start:635 stop:1039 length:405 start_codon:yes stop_codon:yes gene_type:complete